MKKRKEGYFDILFASVCLIKLQAVVEREKKNPQTKLENRCDVGTYGVLPNKVFTANGWLNGLPLAWAGSGYAASHRIDSKKLTTTKLVRSNTHQGEGGLYRPTDPQKWRLKPSLPAHIHVCCASWNGQSGKAMEGDCFDR